MDIFDRMILSRTCISKMKKRFFKFLFHSNIFLNLFEPYFHTCLIFEKTILLQDFNDLFFLKQLALYNYMYSNYMQSISLSIEDPLINTNFAQFNETATIVPDALPQDQTPQAQPQPPPPQPARNRQANNNNDVGERDDDWLSMLHNIVSFFVLFSIIYYYSSLERFLLIISIVFILILYVYIFI